MEQCSICLNDLSDDDHKSKPNANSNNNAIYTTDCNHKFHIDCLKAWTSKKKTKCPLCRNKLISFLIQYENKYELNYKDNNDELTDDDDYDSDDEDDYDDDDDDEDDEDDDDNEDDDDEDSANIYNSQNIEGDQEIEEDQEIKENQEMVEMEEEEKKAIQKHILNTIKQQKVKNINKKQKQLKKPTKKTKAVIKKKPTKPIKQLTKKQLRKPIEYPPYENDMEYVDANTLPVPKNYRSKDYEYGHSFLPPENWYPQPPHPPVCVTDKRCPVCPVYTEGVPIDVKEWDSSRTVTAPVDINLSYYKDKMKKSKKSKKNKTIK